MARGLVVAEVPAISRARLGLLQHPHADAAAEAAEEAAPEGASSGASSGLALPGATLLEASPGARAASSS